MTAGCARIAVFAVASLLLFTSVPPTMAPAEALRQVIMVGVVDFYAQTPLGTFSGVIPERFAADELSRLLAGAPAGRFEVIPRETMQQAEGAMRWQDADVLHFDRLRALAHAVAADRLVVGWIPQLQVETGGEGGTSSADQGGVLQSALVNLVIKVFDEAQARVVGETHQSANIFAPPTRSLLAAQVLRVALQHALPDVLSVLTAQL